MLMLFFRKHLKIDSFPLLPPKNALKKKKQNKKQAAIPLDSYDDFMQFQHEKCITMYVNFTLRIYLIF